MATASAGETLLHLVAGAGNVEYARMLLQRDHGDPNVTDEIGRTPLFAACAGVFDCVELVQLLVGEGADPSFLDDRGCNPLHVAALHGHVNMVDMLFSKAPATLNRVTDMGQTPLFAACVEGHEKMVSKLLSLGAIQPKSDHDGGQCPLAVAIRRGYAEVVRILIRQEGLRAVGGEGALSNALRMALQYRRAVFLPMLLTVGGEEMRSRRANTALGDRRLIHIAAGCCYPAAVSILLGAGADEACQDPQGWTPLHVIGLFRHPSNPQPQTDSTDKLAVIRMLGRGPAYRARSWAWPVDEQADDDGDTAAADATAAAAAAAAAAVPSPPPAMTYPPLVSFRVFRPKSKTSSDKRFMTLIDRYCAKG